MNHFWMTFGASLAAALVTTAGILVIRNLEGWGRRNSACFACFAAGVLISVSFLHLIPKALSMNGAAAFYLLAGYLFVHLFNRFLSAHVCDRPDTADYAIGLVPLLGIGVHSFIDGVIYSVAFTVSPFTGAAAAIGMILHEFPEGVVTYVLLLRAGFTGRRAFALAFAAAAATTPLGTLVSYPMVARIEGPALGALLSISAGALIYVGASHLLPVAEREARRGSFWAFAGGVVLAIGIVLVHQ
jgi:zinc and cadmium transporter